MEVISAEGSRTSIEPNSEEIPDDWRDELFLVPLISSDGTEPVPLMSKRNILAAIFRAKILTRFGDVRVIDMRPRKLGFDLGDRGWAILRKPAHPVSQSSTLRIILALLVLSSVFSSAQTESPSVTGIEGVITVSPIRPGPIRAGSDIPNAAPLPNAVFTVGNAKGMVTSFTTDSEGRFRVSLKPGHYVIVLAEHRFPRPCGPFEMDVESAKMTKVEWRCETGRR